MPYEAWCWKKPDLGHIKVFGCSAYMKVPAVHVKKLDDRGKQVVYLGRELGIKGNRLYDPTTGKLQVSKDVVFFENEFWAWEQDGNTKVAILGHVFDLADEQGDDQHIDIEQEMSTPIHTNHVRTGEEYPGGTCVSSATSSEPRRLRSLEELYNETEVIEMLDELMLLKAEEPTSFVEASEGK
ncbi:hypothetical protein AgCh_036700 [Apium graveolens]